MSNDSRVEEYLRLQAVSGLAPGTIRLRRGILERWNGRVADVLQATRDDLVDYVEHLRAEGRKPQYIRLIESTLQGFYRWLQESGDLDRTLFAGYRLTRVGGALPKKVDLTELEQLIEAVRVHGDSEQLSLEDHAWKARFDVPAWRRLRNWVLCSTCYMAGLRAKEALYLRWQNVLFEEEVLRLEVSKTGEREVPVIPMLAERLRKWQEVNGPLGNHFMFPSQREEPLENYKYESFVSMIKAAGDDAGVSVCTHDFRRGCATMAANHRVPLSIIAAQLGHKSQQTTERYFTIDPKTANLAMTEAFNEAATADTAD